MIKAGLLGSDASSSEESSQVMIVVATPVLMSALLSSNSISPMLLEKNTPSSSLPTRLPLGSVIRALNASDPPLSSSVPGEANISYNRFRRLIQIL